MDSRRTTGKVTVLLNPVTQRAFELFPPGYDVAGVELSDPQAAERLRETEVLVTSGRIALDRALIQRMPNLRFVQTHGVRLDESDHAALADRRSPVARVQGSEAPRVAEHAMLLLLLLSRQCLRRCLDLKQRGEWRGAGEEAWELAGKTMAILGFGYIGRSVARKAQGFDMRVIAWNRDPDKPRPPADGVEFFPLETVLREADVLCIATPLSSQTRGLINAERLALMKPTAILVNVGRGEIVDQAALIDAVESARLAGAGLDVTTPEPLPPDDPLLKVDRIVITPHYAGGSRDSRPRARSYIYENVARYFRGETPLRLVTPESVT